MRDSTRSPFFLEVICYPEPQKLLKSWPLMDKQITTLYFRGCGYTSRGSHEHLSKTHLWSLELMPIISQQPLLRDNIDAKLYKSWRKLTKINNASEKQPLGMWCSWRCPDYLNEYRRRRKASTKYNRERERWPATTPINFILALRSPTPTTFLIKFSKRQTNRWDADKCLLWPEAQPISQNNYTYKTRI